MIPSSVVDTNLELGKQLQGCKRGSGVVTSVTIRGEQAEGSERDVVIEMKVHRHANVALVG